MNQKHILPSPKFLVFSAFSLPQSFSLLPTSPDFALTPSPELRRLEAGPMNFIIKAQEHLKGDPRQQA
jgi:hypothetical protein